MIAEGVELPAERPGKDIVMCLLELNAPRIWGDYELARARPLAAKAGNEELSFLLGYLTTAERMGFMEMYLLAAEQFYEA